MSLLKQYDDASAAERWTLVLGWIRTSWPEFCEELRERRPILVVGHPTGAPPMAVVTRQRSVVEVLSQERVFTVEPYRQPMEAALGGKFMLSRDDEAVNWRDRGVMQAVMSRDDLPRVRALAGRFSDQALDRAAARGYVDVVGELGRAVPLRLCADYFGFVGPDAASMRRWARDIHHDALKNVGRDPLVVEAADRAGAEMRRYLRRLVERRDAELRTEVAEGRSPADVAPDVLGRLLRLRLPEELSFDDSRIVANIGGLLVGSVETTSQAVVHVLDLLLSPERSTELGKAVAAARRRDPKEFDAYVWEALRFKPINQLLVRRCERDHELQDGNGSSVVIEAGTLVLACTASAMMDETVFTAPESFDPHRSSGVSLHFGLGHHSCLGRYVGEQVVPEIVRRVLLRPGVARADGATSALEPGSPFPERFVLTLEKQDGEAKTVSASTVSPSSSPPAVERRDDGADGRVNRCELKLLTHGAPFWAAVQRTPGLSSRFNAFLVNRAAGRMPPRPNQFSTAQSYTSWGSLTDRTYDDRHLPPRQDSPQLPDIKKVEGLFRAPDGGERECPKSTLLFAYFAQWFTDGFLRTDPADVRKNTSSHQIDLGQLYGRTPEATRVLRSFRDGKLAVRKGDDGDYPPMLCRGGAIRTEYSPLAVVRFAEMGRSQRDTLFAIGSDRANTLPGTAMINVLFLREHNRIAQCLHVAHKDWDDDRLFETARNTLTVMLLKIVLEEYVNHITPYHFKLRLEPQKLRNPKWYRTNWMAIEFDLLYRWHSLLPGRLRVGGQERFLADVVADNRPLLKNGLDALFVEASAQAAGAIGLKNTDGYLLPTEVASVKQGREVGLMPYNEYRKRCGFGRVKSFGQVTGNPALQEELKALYHDNVDEIDFYVGIFAEDPRPRSPLGPLMGRMVGVDALSQALTNPLLAQQVYKPETFAEGWDMIHSTSSLADILRRNVPGGKLSGRVSMTRAGAR